MQQSELVIWNDEAAQRCPSPRENNAHEPPLVSSEALLICVETS